MRTWWRGGRPVHLSRDAHRTEQCTHQDSPLLRAEVPLRVIAGGVRVPVPGVGVNRIIVGVTTRGWVIVIVEVMNIIARVPAEAIIVIRIIVLITGRGTSWRPQALLIQDAGENLIPQASPHTGVCNGSGMKTDSSGRIRQGSLHHA